MARREPYHLVHQTLIYALDTVETANTSSDSPIGTMPNIPQSYYPQWDASHQDDWQTELPPNNGGSDSGGNSDNGGSNSRAMGIVILVKLHSDLRETLPAVQMLCPALIYPQE